MSLQKFVIYLAASFFILYGLAFSVFPTDMSLLVTGTSPQGISAIIDFRATYGGMTVAVGLIILYLHANNQTRAGLVAIVIVLLCMAIPRTIGLLVDGNGNIFMYLYLVLEVVGSLLALYAMRRVPASD